MTRLAATSSCDVMCVTPESGSTLCARPAASNADDNRKVWAATTLSSAKPCTIISGRRQRGGVVEQRADRIRGGRRVGAEVSLRVERVVQPEVSHRCSRDGSMKNVGTPQHGQCRKVAAERPTANAHPRQIEIAVIGCHGVQRIDLILEHCRCEVSGDRTLPCPGPAPACRDRRRSRQRIPDRPAIARSGTRRATPRPAARGARRTDPSTRAARTFLRRGHAVRRGRCAPRDVRAWRSRHEARTAPAPRTTRSALPQLRSSARPSAQRRTTEKRCSRRVRRSPRCRCALRRPTSAARTDRR